MVFFFVSTISIFPVETFSAFFCHPATFFFTGFFLFTSASVVLTCLVSTRLKPIFERSTFGSGCLLGLGAIGTRSFFLDVSIIAAFGISGADVTLFVGVSILVLSFWLLLPS